MRTKKNIITGVIIVLCLISMYFTMDHAKQNTVNVQNNNIQQEIPQGGMQMPQNGFEGGMQPGMQGGMQMPNQNMTPTQPGNMQEMPGQGAQQMMPSQENGQMMQENRNKVSLSAFHFGLLIVESVVLALCVIYLLMSKMNALTWQETFINKDKILICVLSTILFTEVFTLTNVFIYNRFFTTIQTPIVEENEEYEEIDEGVIVNDSVIDLSQYDSNITLKEAKEYTLIGEFKHAVLIDSDGEVTIKLNDVVIESSKTAAIANISTNEVIVHLVEGSTNTLSDGGASQYDGCLYSNGELTIEGEGTLYVKGNQEEGEGIATTDQNININGGNIYIECNDDGLNAGGDAGGMITINDGLVYVHASGDGIDSNNGLTINGGVVYSMGSALGGDAGIDTDGGYHINGGLVIGLGSDMLETPLDTSKQKAIALNLSETVKSGTLVTLINANDEVVVSFVADEDFKTLILSVDQLESGTYSLYSNGKHSGQTTASIHGKGTYTKGDKILDIEL